MKPHELDHNRLIDVLYFRYLIKGVHSTLFLDQWGKSSASEGPPPLTLSPIEEFDPKVKTNHQISGNATSTHPANHTVQSSLRRKGFESFQSPNGGYVFNHSGIFYPYVEVLDKFLNLVVISRNQRILFILGNVQFPRRSTKILRQE